MNNINEMPTKCHSCHYWEVCEYPYVCSDMRGKVGGVERPKGHWIKKWSGNGWNEDWDYICSVCGKKYEKASSILCHASYCPDCGANMIGEAMRLIDADALPKLVGKHADVTIIDEGANNETGNEVP